MGQVSLQNGLCTSSGSGTTCWALLGWLGNVLILQLKQQWNFVETKKMDIFQRNLFVQWLSSLWNLEIALCQQTLQN